MKKKQKDEKQELDEQNLGEFNGKIISLVEYNDSNGSEKKNVKQDYLKIRSAINSDFNKRLSELDDEYSVDNLKKKRKLLKKVIERNMKILSSLEPQEVDDSLSKALLQEVTVFQQTLRDLEKIHGLKTTKFKQNISSRHFLQNQKFGSRLVTKNLENGKSLRRQQYKVENIKNNIEQKKQQNEEKNSVILYFAKDKKG